MNTNHTGKFTTSRVTYIPYLHGDVMLTSLKSRCSPTKINILLKFCLKKNVTAPVNLFVNLLTETRVAVVDESDSTVRKSRSGRPRTARYDDKRVEVAGPHHHRISDCAVA